jgi:hypothetical protein
VRGQCVWRRPRQLLRSLKVRLIIRFDEFGDATTLVSKVPPKTTKNLDGVKVERGNLEVVDDPTAPVGTHRFLLQAPGSSSPTNSPKQDRIRLAPQEVNSSADGLTFLIGGIVPVKATWEQNGIRTADTFRCTLRYADLPFDPRTARSCAVEYYLGTVTAADYLAGAEGRTRQRSAPPSGTLAGDADASEPANTIPDAWVDDAGRQRTNLRFQGFVDKWSDNWDEDGEPVLELQCRDNTSLLIGQALAPKFVVSMKKPLDEAVADFLSVYPQLEGLSIEYRPQGDPVPVLDKVLDRGAFRPNLGPPPNHGGGGERHSVWDYLTDVCGAIGHNIRVEGTTVVIQRVRSMYTTQPGQRDDDPFRGRQLADGTAPWNTRRFLYGRNVQSLRIARNFTRKAAQNIEVRSYSTETKSTIVARFPEEADRQAFALPGDATPDQKWLVMEVSGVKDKATLKVTAQEVYEAQGRNELEVDIKTIQLASFGGGNADPDIFDMRATDEIEILVAREDLERNTTSRIETQMDLVSAGVRYLERLGFSGPLARKYAETWADAGFQTVFRVRKVKAEWDEDDGVELSIQAINYIQVRADRLSTSGTEPKNVPNAPRPAPTSLPNTQTPTPAGQYAPPAPQPPPTPSNPGPPGNLPNPGF